MQEAGQVLLVPIQGREQGASLPPALSASSSKALSGVRDGLQGL